MPPHRLLREVYCKFIDRLKLTGDSLMFSLKGYYFSEKIYESNKSIIFRGKREVDNLPIVAKVLKVLD